ncbi:MAG: hypothetical protein Q7T16_04290 [Candidatus Burarchaeum sp.]|nr:hypothetical protein [Candidatus Burarchaeum sp.]MDO8339849.1 hypothetical protein [Candidatus Burarchaeum sp.]
MGGAATAAKAAVRILVGLVVGALIAYEYYAFSPNPDEALWPAVGMAIVTAIVVAFMLRGLGKGSE